MPIRRIFILAAGAILRAAGDSFPIVNYRTFVPKLSDFCPTPNRETPHKFKQNGQSEICVSTLKYLKYLNSAAALLVGGGVRSYNALRK